jgi:hypothetical protein
MASEARTPGERRVDFCPFPESERGAAKASPAGQESVKWLSGCVSPRILSRQACHFHQKRQGFIPSGSLPLNYSELSQMQQVVIRISTFLCAYIYCISCSTFSRVFSIKSFHGSSSTGKPWRGGEKRTTVWASHPEKRGSDDGVAPPGCAHRVVPQRWVGLDQCHPSGAAADAGHDAAAWVRGAARAADDGVVDIPRALSGAPRAP